MPSRSKTTFSFPSLLLIRLQLHLCFFPKPSNNFLLLHATYHPISLMIVGPSWELWSGMKVATSFNVICSPSFFAMGIPWGYVCHFGQILLFNNSSNNIFFPVPRTIYPPTKVCSNEDCPRTRKGVSLQKAEQRQAVLYTLDNGALPVWSVHFYCQGMSWYIFARTIKSYSF